MRLLSTMDMARFVTDGMLVLEAAVPDRVNRRAVAEIETLRLLPPSEESPLRPASGTPLPYCYPRGSAIRGFLDAPRVAGAIRSLVGDRPAFDHYAVHKKPARSPVGQELHADAAIDASGPAFDIQLMYFPHDVAPGEGGTRLVPGSHLRLVHENAVARYENIVGEIQYSGPAGTVVVLHHGIWHAGQPNPADTDRYMFKVRLNPTAPQVKLWDTSDYDDVIGAGGALDHKFATTRTGRTVANELRRAQPWCFTGDYRLELMQRVRLWRYLSGDAAFDVDWYHTRLESRPRPNPAVAATT